ncbi:MAG TPA: CocE/NonD family hydrolase [Bacteroidales bacterium]|nr:CocE/NonD family hydrolase [Bacteroidales bacterium]HQJ81189.1 CocE/NonD family hydrolase [Bacteroidales bacterium]
MKKSKKILKTALPVLFIMGLTVIILITWFKGRRIETEITMSDGTALSTILFIPGGGGRFPAVMIRTPYNKYNEEWIGRAFSIFRIAVVIQDVRGKFKSEGEFCPFLNERKDGLETIRWIRKQSWSDGTVAGWGASYLGYTQWAVSDSLDFITPLLSGARLYDLFYPDSLFSLQTAGIWGFEVASDSPNSLDEDIIRKNLFTLPVIEADDVTIRDIAFYNDWVMHEEYDSYWKQMDFRGRTAAHVLSVAGWYDLFLQCQIADFQALDSSGNNRGRLVIGPWAHGEPGEASQYGGTEKTGDPKLIFRYARRYLKGKKARPGAPMKDAKYNLFIMERNEYTGSETWPPEETRIIPYYLGPDGYLDPCVPSEEGSLSYEYDPADPYPSLGGTALGKGVGPARQNPSLKRKDQLVFRRKIEEEPLILLGPLSASLWLSSSASCTDFYVLLQDEFPDGKIINIQEGGAKFRMSGNEAERTEIRVWATGYQLNPGHSLRVVISSSWFPRFNRNLNNCEKAAYAKTIRTSTQTVWYGSEKPSSVNLPVYYPAGEGE